MIITSEHGSPTHCVIYGARTKTNIGLRYILTRRAKPIRNVLSSNPIPHPFPLPPLVGAAGQNATVQCSSGRQWNSGQHQNTTSYVGLGRSLAIDWSDLCVDWSRTMNVLWHMSSDLPELKFLTPFKASKHKRPRRRKRRHVGFNGGSDIKIRWLQEVTINCLTLFANDMCVRLR